MQVSSMALLLFLPVLQINAQRIMENLDRGVVAINKGNSVYIGWRLLVNDPDGIAFNVYRTTAGTTLKLNDQLITNSTNFIDKSCDLSQSNSWSVRSVIARKESNNSKPFVIPANAAV